MKISGHTLIIREKKIFREFLWGLVLDTHVGMENLNNEPLVDLYMECPYSHTLSDHNFCYTGLKCL